MYDSKNDQALLNTTGLDHKKTFQELVDLYAPYYLRYMWDKRTKKVRRKKLDKHGRPYRRKPRDMDAIGSLGLVLTWYRTRGSCTRTLSFIFGLTVETYALPTQLCVQHDPLLLDFQQPLSNRIY